MAIDDKKLYRFHVENIRSIEIALKHSAISARNAIATENRPATRSFISLHAFLLGAWAENRLLKLLFEMNGISLEDRNLVNSQSAQIDQWLKLVEVAFRKHYDIPKAILSKNTLLFSPHSKYVELTNILDVDLRSVIEVRNKLAHGQWVYPLNSDNTNVEQEKFQLLNNENLPSLQYKHALLTNMANIIHDLVVSLPTFDRDFDKNYKNITNTRRNLENRSYIKYSEILIKKRKKGIELRKHNIHSGSQSIFQSIELIFKSVKRTIYSKIER